MRLYNVIKKPIITEKSALQEMKNNTFVIKVLDSATKIDIKKSIIEIYGLEVASVRIVNSIPKVKQTRKGMAVKGMAVKRKSFKKAYVTLKDSNAKIDFSILK